MTPVSSQQNTPQDGATRHYSFDDVRKTAKPRDTWWGYFFLTPVSTRCTWLVANHTRLKPETICIASLMLGLCALPFFWQGDRLSLLVGAVIAVISNVMDGIDGKLARLKGEVTTFGGYLDTVGDILKHSLYAITLTFGQYHQGYNIQVLYVGIFVLWVLLMKYANENLLGRIRATLPANGVTSAIDSPQEQEQGVFRKIDRFFAGRGMLPAPGGGEIVPFMFMAGPALNQVMPCLLIGGVGFAVYMAAYTIMTLKRTQKLTRGLMPRVQD